MPHGSEIVLLIAVLVLLISCRALRAKAKADREALSRAETELSTWKGAHEALLKNFTDNRETLAANSSFLANIGQELRSPLSGVLGMIELLYDTKLSNEQRELTKAMNDSANALLAVVSDLQDLSRIESGKVIPQTVPFDVNDVIREACSLSAEGIRRKKLFLNIDADPQIPAILLGDRVSVRQVLSQLLRNAVATTLKGGIVLRATRGESSDDKVEVLFSVKDTGLGFSEEEQRNLFEPFSGEAVWTRSHEGTGLGLFLSKRTLDTIGGAMTVESKKGIGSEFRFALKFGIGTNQRSTSVVSLQDPDDQATSGNHPYTRRRSMDR